MYNGPLLFALTLVPVWFFIQSLGRLRHALKDDERSSRALPRALMRMPLLMLVAPLVMWGMMTAEARLDPDFLARSFVNSEEVTPLSLFSFAIDQTLKGGLFDAMEIFKVNLTELEHQCSSRLFCTSLLIFRTIVGTALSVFIFALLVIASRMGERIASRFRRAEPVASI